MLSLVRVRCYLYRRFRKRTVTSTFNLCLNYFYKNVSNYSKGADKSDHTETVEEHLSSAKYRIKRSRNLDIDNGTPDRLLVDDKLICGQLRILNRSVSYIQHPVDNKRIFILGRYRQKASNGDVVGVRILPYRQWRIQGTENLDHTVQLAEDKTSQQSLEHFVPITSLEAVTSEPIIDSNVVGDIEDPPLCGEQSNNLATTIDANINNKSPLDRSSSNKIFSMLTVNNVLKRQLNYPDIVPLDVLQNFDSKASSILHPLPHPNIIRVGKVVAVLKTNPVNKKLLGHIVFFPDSEEFSRDQKPLDAFSNSEYTAVCLFLPKSNYNPLVKLDPETVPKRIWKNVALGRNTTYICKIMGWDRHSNIPFGMICDDFENQNEIELATKEILVHFGLEERQFTSKHLSGLPENPDQFIIPRVEYKRRKDFRSCCVITVDPASAKDFDDALHIKQLGNGLYEVGIHIADVSYFVRPNTPLDNEAAQRTTSIYLVQRVIPMLPPILSEHLCSLVPKQDRLAFSIVLTVNECGKVIHEWFGRSIIRSCARLSYDDAWNILNFSDSIDNCAHTFPTPESPFTFQDLQQSLSSLHKIAQNLRKARVESGALVLEKVELQFHEDEIEIASAGDNEIGDGKEMDHDKTKMSVRPCGFSSKIRNPAHYLIEEWMILANQTVARCLYAAFNTIQSTSISNEEINDKRLLSKLWIGGLLRRHPDPDPYNLATLAKFIQSENINLDVTNAVTISNSLETLLLNDEPSHLHMKTALSYLIYKQLSIALYFSLDDSLQIVGNDLQLPFNPNLTQEIRDICNKPSILNRQSNLMFDYTWHFGLNIPLYTHFTSPIRRYADLLVHRQLAKILECSDNRKRKNDRSINLPNKSFGPKSTKTASIADLTQLSVHATWCNDRRLRARRAGEASQRLFLTAFLKYTEPIIEDGIVIDLSRSFVKVLITNLGMVIHTGLNQFLSSAFKWKFNYTSNPSEQLPSSQRPTLTVIWSPPSTTDGQDTTESEQSKNTMSIHRLSVITCRVHCLPDKLDLGAQLIHDGKSISL